jgi:molybdate transport system ATP-binding protein
MSYSDATISARYVGALGSFQIDVAFDAPMRGITALFGPSGCGKTTILRCVAGLSRLPGRLAVGGDLWQDDETGAFREPYERPIGYVFQEASLFAHLSVRENLLYGRRRALRKGVGEKIRLDDVVELLGVGHLLDRATGALSGGERQRVALGRALLAQPRLLLMDEPLSALDRMTKEEIFPYFEALHSALSIPVLYVSHDISEVERLADHMVLLEAGRVVATGPLNDLLADSRLPIARSPQASTVLEACVGAFTAEDSLTALDIDGETLLSPGRIGKEGSTHRVRIAASDVSLSVERPSPTTILNIVPVRVKDIQPLEQGQINVVVTIGHREGGRKLLVRVTRRAQRVLGFGPGQDLYAQIKAVSLVASSGGRAASARPAARNGLP